MIVDILKAKQFINAEARSFRTCRRAVQGHALVSRIGDEFEGGGTMAASSARGTADWGEDKIQAIYGGT